MTQVIGASDKGIAMPGLRVAVSRTDLRKPPAPGGSLAWASFMGRFCLCLLALLLVGGGPARADVLKMTLDELIQRAAPIVEGEFIGKRSRLNLKGNLIVTDYQFAVREVLFGSSAAYLTLTIAGGEIDEVRDTVSDMPGFAVGDRAVLMLREGGMEGSLAIVGVFQGQFRAVQRAGDPRWYMADGSGVLIPRAGAAGYYGYDEGIEALRDYIPMARARPPVVLAAASIQLQGKGDRSQASSGSPSPEELVLFSDPADSDELRSRSLQAADFFTERDLVPVAIGTVPADSAWRAALERAVGSWNRYASLFTADIKNGQEWAFGNGINDVPGLVSEQERREQHGTGWEDGAIVTVLGRYENDVMVESDVLLNPAVNWTFDDGLAYADADRYSANRALLRALGSSVGLNWQGAELSVMNLRNSADKYGDLGLLYGEDVFNVRAAFPTRAGAVDDLGVYLYRAGATNKYDAAKLSATSVVQGESFQVQNFVIENLGDGGGVVPRVHWYLDPAPNDFSGQYIGSSDHQSLNPGQALQARRVLTVPQSFAPGSYYLRAALANGGDESANDSSWLDQPISVLAAAEPVPPVPAAPSASDGTFGDRVQVSWAAVAGAQSYDLARCDSAGSVNGSCASLSLTATSVADVLAEPGRTYYYSLRACNASGCSGFSAADAGSRAVAVPAVPAAPVASDGSYSDRVQVNWAAVAGAQSYDLARCDSAGGVNGSCISLSVTATSYADTAAEPGRTYYYSLRACNANDCSGYSAADAGSRARAVPAVPTGPEASDGAYTDRIRVTWPAVAGATAYKVSRCTDAAGKSCAETDTANTAFDDAGMPAKVTLYYRVRACNAAGCSEPSAGDSGFRAAALPAVPARPDASDAVIGLVRVRWAGVAGADRYEVYRCPGAALSGCQQFAAKDAAFDDAGVSPGTAYYYRIKACGADGCSDYSAYDIGRAEYRDPTPRLTVNGQGQLDARVGDPLVIRVALEANGNPKPADWWVTRSGPDGLRYFDPASGRWLERAVVAYQGALFDLAPLAVLTDRVTGAGTYTYSFAVDTVADGQLSAAQLHHVAVAVRIAPPLPPPTPAKPAASDGSFTDKVRVSWSSAARAERYELYRCGDTGLGACASVGSTAQTALNDTGAVTGRTYYYRVRACNSGGCSDPSSYDPGLRAFVDPRATLTVGGGRTAITIKVGATPSLELGLSSFGNRANADWWLVIQQPGGNYLSYRSGLFPGWFAGLQPALRGSLQDLGGVTLPLPKLSVGRYVVYFGVDTVPDGVATMNRIYYDSVSVTVESCGKFEC